jgi:hypothetical protein
MIVYQSPRRELIMGKIPLSPHIRNFLLSPFLHSENPMPHSSETVGAEDKEMAKALERRAPK